MGKPNNEELIKQYRRLHTDSVCDAFKRANDFNYPINQNMERELCLLEAELLSKLNRLDELEIYVQQLRGALGYSVTGDIKENPEIVNGIADALEKENKELKEKDLYWRKRVTELEENENRFPTLAEFSNLQDDYEQTSKENVELRKQVENLKKYRTFFESCSCLFAEGVEFMTKTEIYEAIKKETKQLESA